MAKVSARAKVIEGITAPLGFFVLALLIVESFLASVVIGGNLEKTDQMTGVWMGVILFVFVNVVVFILVWFKPENLTYDKEAHLISHGMVYGSESNAVGDPESLPSDRATPRDVSSMTEEGEEG